MSMAQFVHPDVQEFFDNPGEGNVELVLVLADGATPEVSDRVSEFDGQIEHELSGDRLIVTLPASNAEEFCETGKIRSVSFNDRSRVLSSGNP